MQNPAFTIRIAGGSAELEQIRMLFRAYARSLSVDLAYQDFEGELAALPGKYAPPAGRLMLAVNGEGRAIGCVALRPLQEPGACEMKRLYVAPEGRGLGLGRALALAVIREARHAGYREIRLDTLPDMLSAQALYARLGFVEMPPYYDSPVSGTRFLRRDLTA